MRETTYEREVILHEKNNTGHAVSSIPNALSGIYSWWKTKSRKPEAIARLIGSLAFLGLGLWILLAIVFIAGAVVLLAFLVPWSSPWLYAAEVALGAAVWVAAALVLFPGIRPTFVDKDEDPIADAPKESARA